MARGVFCEDSGYFDAVSGIEERTLTAGFFGFCTVKVVVAERFPNGPRSQMTEAVTILPIKFVFGVHDTEHVKPQP